MAKTKQTNIRATFTTENHNAVNHSGKLEVVSRYLVIDKKSECVVVQLHLYMGRGAYASQVKAAVWITLAKDKKPEAWQYGNVSGKGSAGGYGYDKQSAAAQDALTSAGVQLWGSPYTNIQAGEKIDFKKRAYIGGVGESAIRSALMATAYAAGFKDCILVSA